VRCACDSEKGSGEAEEGGEEEGGGGSDLWREESEESEASEETEECPHFLRVGGELPPLKEED